MKNLLEILKSRSELTEEIISKLEDKQQRLCNSKNRDKREGRKVLKNIHIYMGHHYAHQHTHNGSTRKKSERKEQKKILEEVMVEKD